MATLDDLAAKKAGNVLKGMDGVVLLGAHPTATAITTLVGTGGTITVPASGYASMGWLSEDGLTWAINRELSELRGWGSASPIRRDVRTEERTVGFMCLETNRTVLEAKNNADYSTVEMTTTGEVKIDIPDRPDTKYWRMLAIARDGAGSSLVYLARTFDRAFVGEIGDQVWSDGDDPIGTEMTLSAQVDDVTGKLGSEFLFGPGALARATEFGFTVETP